MNSETIHPFFQGFDFFSFVHRGGAEEATENTLEAFKNAADMGFVSPVISSAEAESDA